MDEEPPRPSLSRGSASQIRQKWSIFFQPTGLLLANGLLLNSSNHNSSNQP
jgi:hypothetical protein